MGSSAQTSSTHHPVQQEMELVRTHQFPDDFKAIFPHHPRFNAMQSKCFDTVYSKDDNFVLSAPTGSGKTAVLELAICRLISRCRGEEFKVVYQAPTKSLCSERQKDWQAKFSPLGLKCAELTGDTEPIQLRHVQTADILVTTPEKWDSMTRKWKDHRKLMELVKLFLIDEVHILKDDRGACLEAIVSRMKSVGTDIRFVALSATVPNSEDIATWLGLNNRIPGMPAAREVFGEEFRPVQLRKHVFGIQANGKNDFAFDQTCNKHLPDVIINYSTKRKPIMVFCMTRKSTEVTGKLLSQWWTNTRSQQRFWTSSSKIQHLRNEKLRECVSAGVAFHHAGLDQTDRAAIEQGYLTGEINVICCTSTLAVGVNLPCYLVIIKNTVTYQAESCKEYSDIEITQMLGRAGRPQFDDDAVAVIMTRHEKVDDYKKMVSGQEILESKLHLNLIEHLNAEISLGTIRDIHSAKSWLKGTFLFVRFRKNPDHYRLSTGISCATAEEMVDYTCTENLNLLRQFSLINDGWKIKSTEFGDSMARYYVQFETMKLFMGLQHKAKISEILSAIAQAAEFKPVRFRSGEKQMFKNINSSPSIKFPIKVDLALGPHKVSLIIQATLGGFDLRNDDRFSSYSQQFVAGTALVFQHIHRLIRCIVDCQIHLGDSVAARNALELSRSFGARAWDDSPLQLLQIEKIGPVAVRKFINASIRTIEELVETDSQRIDMILSRNPPFGCNLLRDLESFPRLWLSLKMKGKPTKSSDRANSGVSIEVEVELGFLNDSPPMLFRKKPVHVILLSETSDGNLVHFCRISGQKLGKGQSVRFGVDLVNPQQLVNCYVSCDDIAGTQKCATLNPIIPASAFNPIRWPKEHQDYPCKRDTDKTSRPQSVSTNSEDFGINDLNDFDLVAAANTDFEDIDRIDCFSSTAAQAQPPILSKSKIVKGYSNTRQPTRLVNGNWACNHSCKDKSSCKHLCCREGLEKPPKRPKNTKTQSSNSDHRENTKSMNDFFTHRKQITENAEPGTIKTSPHDSNRKHSPQRDSNAREAHESVLEPRQRNGSISDDHSEPQCPSFREISTSIDNGISQTQPYSSCPGVSSPQSRIPDKAVSSALHTFGLDQEQSVNTGTRLQENNPVSKCDRPKHSLGDLSMRLAKKQRTRKYEADESSGMSNWSMTSLDRKRTRFLTTATDCGEEDFGEEPECERDLNIDDNQFPGTCGKISYTDLRASTNGGIDFTDIAIPLEPSIKSLLHRKATGPLEPGPDHHDISHTINPKNLMRLCEQSSRSSDSHYEGARSQGIVPTNRFFKEGPSKESDLVQRRCDIGLNGVEMEEEILAIKPKHSAESESRKDSLTGSVPDDGKKKAQLDEIDDWLLAQFGDIVEFV